MYESIRVREYESTRVREYESTRVREYESTRVREYESTRVREYEGAGAAIGARPAVSLRARFGSGLARAGHEHRGQALRVGAVARLAIDVGAPAVRRTGGEGAGVV